MKKIILLITVVSLSFSEGISGVAYFGYDDNFTLSRVYFTYKKSISDDLSFKFQTDVGKIDDASSDGQDGDVDNDNRWMAFLKKAHIDWKVANETKLSMGMIGMNMLNIQEKTWGYRFLRKSALDLYKFSATADLGMSISKDFGFLFSNLTITNGEGYKESVVDDNSKISLQLVHGERRLDKNDGYNLGLAYSTVKDDSDVETTVTGLFGGWAGKNFRIGAELNTQDIGEISNQVTSIYFNYNINDDFSAFLRQDARDLNVDLDGDDDSAMMLGVIWSPTKGLSICPNITQDKDANNVSEDSFAIDFQFKF
tara:strand:+ start:7045 stop:7977 length:933 start_codon:yes stop_codon:yes gene_type:complete